MNKALNSIALNALLLLCGCREQILHSLSETDVNRLLTKLNQAQIDSEKVRQPDNTWSLAVDRGDMHAALKYLNDMRIIKDNDPAQTESGSIISSREDQRFKYERALSKEIERTLTSVQGVLEARVHLNLPVTDPLFGQPVDKNARGSASVLLVVGAEPRPNPEQIGALVAGASGVERAAVSVVTSISVGEPELQSPMISPQLKGLANQEWSAHEHWLLRVSLVLVGILVGLVVLLIYRGRQRFPRDSYV